jgi:DNA-binding MarR family transcriptional regulator
MSQREPLPPRLPPERTENVLFQNLRTGLALRELMNPVFEEAGVTGEEYGVLGVLHFFPERTPTELATALGMPPTTVSRHIARFVRDDLVERTPNPEDGRSYLLRTTVQGTKVVEAIAPRIGRLLKELAAVSDRPLGDIAAALVALEDAAKRVLAKGVAATR